MMPEENHGDGARIACIAGTIWLPDGSPVEGAAVTVTAPGTGRQVSTFRTGPDGTYDIYLAAGGTYLVIVSAPGRRPAADLVTVTGGRAQHDLVLGNSGTLTGVARMAGTGDPVSGTVVTLTDARGQVVTSGITAADGQYRLDGLDSGDYTLAGTAPGVAPVARTASVPGTADLAFALRGYRVAALVTGPGGTPFAGAVVTLDGSDGPVATGVSDGLGTVAFEDVPAGRYTLGAEGSDPGVAVARTRRGRVTRADIRLGKPRGAGEDRAGSLFLPGARVSPERDLTAAAPHGLRAGRQPPAGPRLPAGDGCRRPVSGGPRLPAATVAGGPFLAARGCRRPVTRMRYPGPMPVLHSLLLTEPR